MLFLYADTPNPTQWLICTTFCLFRSMTPRSEAGVGGGGPNDPKDEGDALNGDNDNCDNSSHGGGGRPGSAGSAAAVAAAAAAAAGGTPIGGGDMNPASNGHTAEHQQPDQDVPDGVKQPPPTSSDCQTPVGAPGQQPGSNQAGSAGQQQPPSMNSMNTANAGEATDGGDSFLNEFKEEGGNHSIFISLSFVRYFSALDQSTNGFFHLNDHLVLL